MRTHTRETRIVRRLTFHLPLARVAYENEDLMLNLYDRARKILLNSLLGEVWETEPRSKNYGISIV